MLKNVDKQQKLSLIPEGEQSLVLSKKITFPEPTKEEFEIIEQTIIEEARKSFWAWLNWQYPQTPDQTYVIGEFHAYLADLIQSMVDGRESPYQAVSAPPQHGKSRLIAVRFVAWYLGFNPGVNVALTGFSHSLLVDFILEIRDIIATEEYQKVFPGLMPKKGRKQSDATTFTNGSRVIGKSAGSKLAGRKVDLLIVDDPHPGRAEAESPTLRRKVKNWYFADCVSRFSADAKVFLIHTRWHPDDLIGSVTSKEYVESVRAANSDAALFKVTNLKAIAEADDPLGREPGEALFPEQRPIKFLLNIKAQQPGYEWLSQYQGMPVVTGGGQCDIGKIVYLHAHEVPDSLSWVRGWDLAITEDQNADWTAGVLVAHRIIKEKMTDCDDIAEAIRRGRPLIKERKQIFIRDVKRGQLAWGKMRALILSTSREDLVRYKSGRMAMEGVAGFEAVCADVRRALSGEVQVIKKNPPRGGKLLRAQWWLNYIEAGEFYMVRGSWNADFVAELSLFPMGEHDDQIDGVSIAGELAKGGGQIFVD